MGKKLIIPGADFFDNAAQRGNWVVTWYNNDLENYTPNAASNPSYAGLAPANYSLFQNKTINMVRLQVRTAGIIRISVANGLNKGDAFSQTRTLDFSGVAANTIVEKQFEPIEVGSGIIIMHLTNDTGKFGFNNNAESPVGAYNYVARTSNTPTLATANTLGVDFGYGRYE